MKKRILGILLSLIMAVGMLPTMAMAQETAPTFNLETDLEYITIPENLVTCICTTANESKAYGQLPGGFTTDGKVIKENGKWTVIVQIEKSTYMKKFNTDTGTTHSPNLSYSSDFTTPIQFKMKYEGGKWVLDGAMPEDKKLHFTCDGQHVMQEPPAFDLAKDLEGITIPENLVTCICTTTDESKSYGQLPGGFATDGKVIKENGKWTVIVQIEKSTYMKKFNTDTGTTHSPNLSYSSDFTTPIQFKMKYEGGKWVLDGAMPEDKKLHFTCNNDHENQTPNLPMYPTIDNISGLNDKIVAVLCANTQDGQKSGKYYGLLNGGFTSTVPTREGDMYESTLRLIPSVYCNQYSTDTGITHTVNPNQTTEGLKFVVKYDEEKKMWMPKEDVKPMGIWVNCDKHETSTSVTPVYPPSGGGSTIKPGSNGSNQGDGAVVNPDNNQGDNKDKVDTGNKQTGKTKKSDTMEKVPKTGDNTGMTIWLVLLLLSVGALFGTVAFDRKRKRI